MLLYPFKKEFNLPPTPIELSNGESREGKVVSQENQSPLSIRIIVFNASKFLRIPLVRVETGERNSFITPESSALIYRMRIKSTKLQIGFGPYDIKCCAL